MGEKNIILYHLHDVSTQDETGPKTHNTCIIGSMQIVG